MKKNVLVFLLASSLLLTGCVRTIKRKSSSSEPSSDTSSTPVSSESSESIESSESSETEPNEIYVCVYDGEYGTDWIDQIAKDYEAKTGVKVHWTADQSILDRMTSDLQVPSYDVYMSHGIAWQQFADKGLLEELDDLYQMKVEGTNQRFVDRLCAGSKEVSEYDGHYYKVNFTQGAGGFVYNVNMFEENGWPVPTTYDEFNTLCQTIVDSELRSVSLEKVLPIAWSGDREYYWDYPVFEWWAQLGGLSDINKFKSYLGDDGKYSTGYEVYNPNTNAKNFKAAYAKWKEFAGVGEFFNGKAWNTNLSTAVQLFADGAVAMIPYAQWASTDIKRILGHDLNFDIAMMKTPRINNLVTTDYNYNVGFGDSIVVAKNIPEKSKVLAKEFIAYLATNQACKTFVEKANGCFLAFDYSTVDLGELLNDTYIRSVYKKLTECINFNFVSTNPIVVANSYAIAPWINNNYYYSKAVASPSDESYSAETIFNNMFQTAKNNWPIWMKKAGISD